MGLKWNLGEYLQNAVPKYFRNNDLQLQPFTSSWAFFEKLEKKPLIYYLSLYKIFILNWVGFKWFLKILSN